MTVSQSPLKTIHEVRILFDSTQRRPSDPTTDSFQYQTVEKHSDLVYPDFYISPQEDALFQYARNQASLPPPLNDKLNLGGNNIFVFAGHPQIKNQGFVKEHFCVRKNKTPAFLYAKYYAYIDESNRNRQYVPKVYVCPTINDDHNGNQVSFLPITGEFKWVEALIEIDAKKARRGRFGIKFGALNFDEGDYFAVEKIALVYAKESPRLSQIQDLFEKESELYASLNSDALGIKSHNLEKSCQRGFCRKFWKCLLYPVRLLVKLFMRCLGKRA